MATPMCVNPGQKMHARVMTNSSANQAVTIRDGTLTGNILVSCSGAGTGDKLIYDNFFTPTQKTIFVSIFANNKESDKRLVTVTFQKNNVTAIVSEDYTDGDYNDCTIIINTYDGWLGQTCPPEPLEPAVIVIDSNTPKDYYKTNATPSDKIIGKDVTFLINGRKVTLFQHTATTVYITLPNTGSNDNYSSYIIPKRKPWGASDSDVYTRFSKVRFDPVSLTINNGDYLYSKSVGHCSHHANANVTDMFPYGTAFDCEAGGSHTGTGNINLLGTSFAVDDSFKHDGYVSGGTWEFSSSNQVVRLTGGGYCGWVCPVSCVNETQAFTGGWYIKLKFL